VIARGMLEIQNLTCLQFVPRESNQEDYISIISGEGYLKIHISVSILFEALRLYLNVNQT